MIVAPSPVLVNFGGPPPYANCDPERAAAAVQAAAANAIVVADVLGTATEPPTWESVMEPLDAAAEWLDREYGLVTHLHAVTATPAWNAVNQRSLAAVVDASTHIGQHAGLYARLCQLRDAGAGTASLTPARAHILQTTIADFELAGVGLTAARRATFATNERRLSQLGAEYEEHVRLATAHGAEIVTDEAALGTMPTDMSAAARIDDGWRFSLLDPSYLAYMTHGTDRSVRERLAKARNARASDLGPPDRDNTDLVNEILKLRWEQARMLDYPDPATMILSRRMADTPATVADFLTQLAELARPAAIAEFSKLSEFARTQLGLDSLQAWDLAYATEAYRQEVTGLSEAAVRPYFGAVEVLAGLLKCVGDLFGVVTKPAAGLPVWDDQVTCLEVFAEDGAKIGNLYLDLYARATKRGGAWAQEALTRCRTTQGQQLPAALMNCNFTASVDGTGPRLGWQEVITLFHEAGHAFHHLLGQVDDFCASGINGVEWDAVELPSQFLENFAWQPQVAIGMSAHVQTGQPLPAELFAKLQAQRIFLPGLTVIRQLTCAIYDLELHRRPDVDPVSLWNEVRNAYMVTPALANDRFPCTFAHIFAGGYAAGYYGYLWALVLAADAYEMFTAPGVDQRMLGRKFATEVLERGSTRPTAVNFVALRGRQPEPAALLRSLGLV